MTCNLEGPGCMGVLIFSGRSVNWYSPNPVILKLISLKSPLHNWESTELLFELYIPIFAENFLNIQFLIHLKIVTHCTLICYIFLWKIPYLQTNLVRKVALFHTLQISLMPGSIEDTSILISASTFNLLQHHISCSLWKTLLYTCEGMRMENTNSISTMVTRQFDEGKFVFSTNSAGTPGYSQAKE